MADEEADPFTSNRGIWDCIRLPPGESRDLSIRMTALDLASGVFDPGVHKLGQIVELAAVITHFVTTGSLPVAAAVPEPPTGANVLPFKPKGKA